MVRLSKRLLSIASFAEGTRVLADVGCDHGLLSLYLLERRLIEKAYLMDINKGPLLKAGENARKFGLEGEIELILSNGFDKLPDFLRERPGSPSPDAAVICGMGGPLILDIISGAPKEILNGIRRYILSPQSEISAFRKGILKLGYIILKEALTEEEGKFYFVMEAVPLSSGYSEEREKPYDEAELRYGRIGLSRRDDTLLKLINRDLTVTRELLGRTNLPEKRREDLNRELKVIEKARNRYEMS